MLALLQLTTLPLSLFSKLPQIQQNHRAQSTGQLSAFAVISQIAGCSARLFTTATEVGDSIVAAGFALALVLNIVLGAQLWMYWGRDDAAGLSEKGGKARMSPAPVEYEPAPWQQQPHTRIATPPPPSQSPALGGRKWARKVD
jgi:mannose-P-dolichol utilization defect protein 1